MEEYMNVNQLAAFLLLKPSTVRTYVHQKRWDLIPEPDKPGGKRIRWAKGKVVEWAHKPAV